VNIVFILAVIFYKGWILSRAGWRWRRFLRIKISHISGVNLDKINQHLQTIESIINNPAPVKAPPGYRVGVDLGTADIMVFVVDDSGRPLSAFMEWAEVVRDGVVLDYWGATQIVKKLLKRTEQKLGVAIKKAVTSYPPGTDPDISANVLKAAEVQVEGIIDEPSSVVHLLGIKEGAVVDIGGGTTGIAVARNHKIVFAADEPTGGRHVTLTLAGNRGVSYEEAEEIKRGAQAAEFRPVVEAVFQKMAEIIRTYLQGQSVKRLYLTGGTCCFPGIDQVFTRELSEYEIIMPYNPLYLTPLAIASYHLNGKAHK